MSEIINKPIGIRCADIYLRFPEIMEDECNDLAEFLEDEHIVYEGATDIFIDQKDKLNKQKKVLDKIKWKPIKEYKKPKYDWVLIKYYIEPEFECIPTVAEKRIGKWYDKNDNEIIGIIILLNIAPVNHEPPASAKESTVGDWNQSSLKYRKYCTRNAYT